MSVEAKRWVDRHSLTRGTARHVLEQLAWAGDREGRNARRTHAELVESTGRSRATVQRALRVLEAEGHIRRHVGCACKECRRAVRGQVVYDVVLGTQDDVAPGQMVMSATGLTVRHVAQDDQPQNEASPASPRGRNRPQNEAPLTKRRLTTTQKERAQARAPQPVDPDEIPPGFPSELSPHLDQILPVLRQVADAKGAAAVSRGAVARTIMARPRRPLIRSAHDFCAYFLNGRGAHRPQRDVVSAYRNWLDREFDLQSVEPMPGQTVTGNGGPGPLRNGHPVAAGDFAKYDRAAGLA